jgi:hypothetical protein
MTNCRAVIKNTACEVPPVVSDPLCVASLLSQWSSESACKPCFQKVHVLLLAYQDHSPPSPTHPIKGAPLQRNVENVTQQQQHNQNGDDYSRCPGYDIQAKIVHTPAHQATIIHQQDNKNQYDRQHGRV